MAMEPRPSFDPKSFLAKVGEGRSIGKYRKDQIVFSQGDPADAVFYIQEGKVKVTVVSEHGKEAVVAVLGTNESPCVKPRTFSHSSRSLYEDMHEGISKSFQGFIAMRKDGTLMGPWNPWLHEARIGKPIWDLTKALSTQSNLPDPARQVAILVTGAHFRAAYEIYAHVAVAEHDKLPDAKLATIVAGQRPPDLTRDEAVAYDVAAALTGGYRS
jgi:4-carboxymuconolactone decarboxylase